MIPVVDDDANLRRLLERELQVAGCRVMPAASGTEAPERARRHRPALVLLDMNGYWREACATLATGLAAASSSVIGRPARGESSAARCRSARTVGAMSARR